MQEGREATMPGMGTKAFKIRGENICRLLPGLGCAIATDAIMVEGAPVGCMERQEPMNDDDSGWAFTSGLESQAYLDDPSRSGVYEVNTVANYDPEIIPFLTYPVGTRVTRALPGEPLEVVEGPSEPPPMRFLMPYRKEPTLLGGGWIVIPPANMLRRLDDGSMVLWKPGLTFYLDLFSAPSTTAIADWAKGIRDRASPDRTDEALIDGPITTLSYRLVERRSPESAQPAWYGFARVGENVIHIAGYFDGEEDEALARAFWSSLSHEEVE